MNHSSTPAEESLGDILVLDKTSHGEPSDDLKEERQHLGLDPLSRTEVALCLSGGGIRSATFSLGVIQALARMGWLERLTYLSTVSGGGYVGSWLSSWIRRSNLATVVQALKNDKGGAEPEEIRRL